MLYYFIPDIKVDAQHKTSLGHVSGLNHLPHLAKSGVLHCDLAEEKVYIVPILNCMEKMGFFGDEKKKTCDKHASGEDSFQNNRAL